MEEYLLAMKILRSQMNDVEDQAAKISVEEEMHLTIVRTLEKEIDSEKSEIIRAKEDTEQMKKAKGEIWSKILENQKKIASSESEISKLTQTLELVRQERVGLSAKLSDKRAYYSEVLEDMRAKFQEQQEWNRAKMISREVREHDPVKEKVDAQRNKTEGMALGFGKAGADGNLIINNRGTDARKNLITKLDSAKERLDEILLQKSNVLLENNKMKLAIEDLKCRINEFKPELKAADITSLQEEYNALLSDKVGETEFLRSLEKQVEKLKEIRSVVNCACGEKYTIAVNM